MIRTVYVLGCLFFSISIYPFDRMRQFVKLGSDFMQEQHAEYKKIKKEGEINQAAIDIILGKNYGRDELMRLRAKYLFNARIAHTDALKQEAEAYIAKIDGLIADPRVDFWADGHEKKAVYNDCYSGATQRKLLLQAEKMQKRRFNSMDF